MRCLVTGANGMLGSALCPLLSKKGYEVIGTDVNITHNGQVFLDIKNFADVEKLSVLYKPEMVFHLAAATDVDKCQLDPDFAFSVNAAGTKNIALICKKLDVPMVYISTGSVFDGKKAEAYIESDQPNPLNVYAKTKYEGEKIVQELLSKYFIVRAGWMIGGGKKDIKFVAKIVKLVLTNKKIQAVVDKKGSPTFTHDLSKGIIELVNTKNYGLYHMANQGSCSRFEIAKKIIEFMGKDDVAVNPVSSDCFPLPAPRPDSEALENRRLNSLGICKMPHWETALKDYIDTLMEEEARE